MGLRKLDGIVGRRLEGAQTEIEGCRAAGRDEGTGGCAAGGRGRVRTSTTTQLRDLGAIERLAAASWLRGWARCRGVGAATTRKCLKSTGGYGERHGGGGQELDCAGLQSALRVANAW